MMIGNVQYDVSSALFFVRLQLDDNDTILIAVKHWIENEGERET